ncbi:MAG: hypothetical protein ABF296_13355 [Oceanococcaceae bacterium]
MMNLAATEFWLNHIYRPPGTRAHGLLDALDVFAEWLGDRDPEALAQSAFEEARLAGRNPSLRVVRYVIAQRLCQLATQTTLTAQQSQFVGAQIPRAEEPPPVIDGYSDGRTTQDWLNFIDAAVTVRKASRNGRRIPEITRELAQNNGGLNLDPLFVREFVSENASA